MKTVETKSGGSVFLHLVLVALIVWVYLLAAGALSGCSSDPNVPNPGDDAEVATTDSGTVNNTDSQQTATQDAQQNNDPCAAYTSMPRDNWTCNMGAAPFVTTIDPVVVEGQCQLRAPGHFWCRRGTPPATDVAAGSFTCIDESAPDLVASCRWSWP